VFQNEVLLGCRDCIPIPHVRETTFEQNFIVDVLVGLRWSPDVGGGVVVATNL